MMIRNDTKISPSLLGLFIINPLTALAAGLRYFNHSWFKNLLWLFVGFYGATFVFPGTGSDGYAYYKKLQEMHQMDISFALLTSLVYSPDSKLLDFVQPIITFVVSRFTDDHRVLFAAFGLVFGYFFSRNFAFVGEKIHSKPNRITVILLLALTLVIPIWNINGFRFWTAAHIFIYGALPMIYSRDYKKSWALMVAFFTHFSFLLPIAILALYLILGNRSLIFFSFFIVSFFISSLEMSFFRDNLLQFTPSAFHGKVESYTHERYHESLLEQRQSDERRWYVNAYGKAFTYFNTISLIFVFLFRKSIWQYDNSLNRLLSFVFLFYAIANIFSLMPSGGRFVSIANYFSLVTVIMVYQNMIRDKKFQRLFLFISPLLVLYMTVGVRIGFDAIGLGTVIGNPLIAVITHLDTRLIDFIK